MTQINRPLDDSPSTQQWRPLEAVFNPDENVALIQLNGVYDQTQDYFAQLWKKAAVKAVSDGAVNRLYRAAQESRSNFLPTFISGDFDSADPEALEYYKKKGCEIIPTPDQDETDFTKCLKILTQRILNNKIVVSSIVVLCSHGGDRFDHVMGNIQTLFYAKTMTTLPVYLVTNASVEMLLSKGQHTIDVSSPHRGDWCGLIPIGCSCDHVTTKGLKWNLVNQRLKFGELVSTSNTYATDAKSVSIETDNTLLWTMGIKPTVKDGD